MFRGTRTAARVGEIDHSSCWPRSPSRADHAACCEKHLRPVASSTNHAGGESTSWRGGPGFLELVIQGCAAERNRQVTAPQESAMAKKTKTGRRSPKRRKPTGPAQTICRLVDPRYPGGIDVRVRALAARPSRAETPVTGPRKIIIGPQGGRRAAPGYSWRRSISNLPRLRRCVHRVRRAHAASRKRRSNCTRRRSPPASGAGAEALRLTLDVSGASSKPGPTCAAVSNCPCPRGALAAATRPSALARHAAANPTTTRGALHAAASSSSSTATTTFPVLDSTTKRCDLAYTRALLRSANPAITLEPTVAGRQRRKPTRHVPDYCSVASSHPSSHPAPTARRRTRA